MSIKELVISKIEEGKALEEKALTKAERRQQRREARVREIWQAHKEECNAADLLWAKIEQERRDNHYNVIIALYQHTITGVCICAPALVDRRVTFQTPSDWKLLYHGRIRTRPDGLPPITTWELIR